MKIFKIKAVRKYGEAGLFPEKLPEFMVQAATIGDAAETAIQLVGRDCFRLTFEKIEEVK